MFCSILGTEVDICTIENMTRAPPIAVREEPCVYADDSFARQPASHPKEVPESLAVCPLHTTIMAPSATGFLKLAIDSQIRATSTLVADCF